MLRNAPRQLLNAIARPLSLTLIVAMLAVPASPRDDSSLQEKSEQIAKARNILAAARRAIGLDSAEPRLWSLQAKASFERFAKYVSVQSPTKVVDKARTLSGKVDIEFVLPDKFRRRVTNRTLTGRKYKYTEVINGEVAWRDPAPPVISSYRDNRVIDVSDVERSREKYAEDVRNQLAFYTLGWILEAPPSLPIEFYYAGEVRAEDRVLDAIVVTGSSEFRPILLIDQRTHLPYAIVVALFESKRETVIVEVASVSRQYISETYARARREREARRTPPRRRELQWRFSDQRPVGGIVLPHQITTLLDGEVVESLTIRDFRLNESVDPKRFEGVPQVR